MPNSKFGSMQIRLATSKIMDVPDARIAGSFGPLARTLRSWQTAGNASA